MSTKTWLIAVAAAGLLLQPAAALAEEAPPELVRNYLLLAKPDSGDALHRALKEHGQWRAGNGETWNWYIYTCLAGECQPGTYAIRSDPKRWVDFDAYAEFNDKALPHFQSTVSPHMARIEAHLVRWLPGISNWPQDAGPFTLFWVYDYELRPGGMQAAITAATQITEHLRAGGWDAIYAWETGVTGTPLLRVVVPAADWAGFAEPSPSLYEVLEAQAGEVAARRLWWRFFRHVQRMDSSIWVEVPELRVTVD